MTRNLNIQPGVSVLSVLRYLNYQPWYALSEFVDNSIQSALDNLRDLQRVDGADYKLKVDITYSPADGGKLIVRDNAAGIHDRDYDRAFKTAQRPPDVSHLAEFGMGMKSAACWFARRWTVRSKALGEEEERTVDFDIEQIVNDGLAELPVVVASAPRQSHYTELVLRDLHQAIRGRTAGKVKTHLASIYRIFERDNFLWLRYNDEVLHYAEPRILKAAQYRNPDGARRKWRQEFDIAIAPHRRVYGFAALRETASTSEAGFAVFRRRRLIQGGGDEGYRPERIFRKPNSYTYQRLFGELHLEGFGVSHTKDAIQWDGLEDTLVERLRSELSKPPVSLLEQAEGYRVHSRRPDVGHSAETAIAGLRTIDGPLGSEVAKLIHSEALATPPAALQPVRQPFERVLDLKLPTGTWLVTVEAVTDPSVGDWVEVAEQVDTSPGAPRRATIRISLMHPFMQNFVGPGAEAVEPIIRIAVGLGLAEMSARDGGVRMAGAVRAGLNQLLRGILSRPS